MTHENANMYGQLENLPVSRTFRSYNEFKATFFPEATTQGIFTLEPTEFGRRIARRAIHNAMISNVDEQGLQVAPLSDTMQIT